MSSQFARTLLLLIVLSLLTAVAGAEELLRPEQAFRFSARVLDPQTLAVRYDIAPGYYMYREKFRFEAPPVQLGAAELPPGKLKDDEIFGKVETYRERVEIKLPLIALGSLPATVTLKATSQGCADIGVCYPPQEQTAQLRLVSLSSASGSATIPGAGTDRPSNPFLSAGQAPATSTGADETRIAGLLASGGFWVIVVSFFGFGVALAFTPCMLPMIPILSGIVVGKGASVTRGRMLVLTLVYIFGMAITYAAAGIAAGLSGSMLSVALQNPWVLGAFGALFVLLALSMFDLFELQLPSALQTWLSERSNRMPGGRYAGVFVMGVLSALIVGPCIAPPLAGALLFIAERGEVALGGSALFAMALGMGVPLVGVGLSAGTLLPKAGPWMQSVKNFFGVVLLGVAIWIVSPVIPVVLQMLAWGALLIFSAIFLHAIDPLPPTASGYRRFWKGVGVMALLAGSSLLLGALAGGRDILQPLARLRLADSAAPGTATVNSDHPGVRFERVANVQNLDARLQDTGGMPVMLDFYADWCVSCKEMERFTFSDAGVKKRLAKFVLLKADVTANNEDDKALLRRFSLFGPPGIIFFNGQGHEIKGLRVIGFQDAGRFSATLDLVRK
jgi:thiol:disulfide interchange protein DsbD